MKQRNEKCVMVIDESLPVGVIANTAAIMGMSLGKALPELIGEDVRDAAGSEHRGIIELPVPVLRGSAQRIRKLRERLGEPEFSGLTAVDFSDLAQGCGTYEEFIEKMRMAPENELNYLGIALCGDKKKVNRLTGCLPLLR
ncbi:MAG: DUF2000 domain-containing protein [Butyricicoccus sp.]|nr:DUF2000 domain-containing protein [Butyricicoccus sp.]